MDNTRKSNLADAFEMSVGGVMVIGGAIINSLLVRPAQRLFNGAAKAVGFKRPAPTGSFTSDIMPFDHE
jgi:hypothetical protein